MTAIEIRKQDNGSHENQQSDQPFPLLEGWALVPDNMLPLENYPFGDAEIEIVNEVPVVVGWSPLPIVFSDPVPPPSDTDSMNEIFVAALVD